MVEKNEDSISSVEQLSYVLPEKSLYLLENKLQEPLRKYKMGKNIDIKWSFCKYFWESHVDLPEIPIDKLELLVN